MRLFKFLFKWGRSVEAAQVLKADPEKREKSIRFSILSIVASIIMVLCSAALFLFPAFKDNAVLFIMFGIIFGFGLGIVGTLSAFAQALHYFILQLSINKKPMTWVALSVFLICIAAAVVIIIYAFTLI